MFMHLHQGRGRWGDQIGGHKNLPSSRIPSSLAHSDVLKNILVNCSNLSFDLFYSHVRAHHDDKEDYQDLSRPSQLNVNMDFNAKQALLDLQPTNPPQQRAFLLEPVGVFADSWKITADMGSQVRYLAHLNLARKKFHQMNILDARVFDLMDWEMVHKTLHNVPKLFQQWACKQVMGIAGTMEWDKAERKKCPSCMCKTSIRELSQCSNWVLLFSLTVKLVHKIMSFALAHLWDFGYWQ